MHAHVIRLNSRLAMTLGVCTLTALCPFSLSAQGTTSADRYAERAYRPAASREQMLECQFSVLTRGLILDSAQTVAVRREVLVFRGPEGAPPRARNALDSMAVARDDAILRVLRSGADSLRYRSNARSEQQWWRSGACNGKR